MFDPKRKATEAILGHMGTISSQLRKQRLMSKLHPQPEKPPMQLTEELAKPSAAEGVHGGDEDEAMEKLRALMSGH